MPASIPAYDLPDRNGQVILSSRPAGVPQAEHFTLADAPIPAPGPGEILVRNIYLSVDPAQRGWASSVANYAAPVPLGGPMRALAVAVVLTSRVEGIAVGEFLYGVFGWQDYAVVGPDAIFHRATQDLPLDAFASLLGINGVSAYLGMTLLGRPVAGETLVASTAAGSVGSFMGQIGRALGLRAIGLTGSDAKVALCTERYGYDAAFNYKTADLDAALADAAPGGVDVYFDNTGGAILDTALRRMNVAGRVVQCGTASVVSWTPPPAGPRNEREILTRRLVWSGFLIFDHMARYAAAADALADMHHAGTIAYDIDLAHGLAAAPGAIAALYAGANLGKSLIKLG